MSHFSGYGAYMLFLALRTHFSNAKYDFFEMHGKVRATKESYARRNDKSFFEKVARDHSAEELRDFYIANILEDKHYVTELLQEEAATNYIKFTGRRQALSYHFSNELDKVFEKGTDVPFAITNGEYPSIVILYLRKIISLETLVLINEFIPYVSKFDKYLSDDIIWSKITLKIRKYKPFLKYPKDKLKHILKEKIDGTTTR